MVLTNTCIQTDEGASGSNKHLYTDRRRSQWF